MIRYVDLELDVVESEGKKRMIDVEEFDQIIQRGFITERLGEKIRELAGKVMKG
jgi:protein associated with RNAse G/E